MVRERADSIFAGEYTTNVISHAPGTAPSIEAVLYVAAGSDGVNDFYENGLARAVGIARYGAHYPGALAAGIIRPTLVIEEHRYGATSIPEQHEHTAGMCRQFFVSGTGQEKIRGLSRLERQHTSERLGVYVSMLLEDTFLQPHAEWSDPLYAKQNRHSPTIRTLHMATKGGDVFVHPTLNSAVRNALLKARSKKRHHGLAA